jgi:small subunit ribosomal protein S7
MSNEINTKEIYKKFINFVMLDGKKTVAIKIMNDTFEIIKSKGQKDPMGVFNKALENLLPKIEVRPKRV